MSNSILTSTKKVCGIDEEYTHFDLDIITQINTTFTTLHGLGIGPNEGFYIDDKEAMWESFIGASPLLNSVKTYVQLSVRMYFDPPTTSYAIAAMEKQIAQLEWRLNVRREADLWDETHPVLTLPAETL